MAVNRTPVLKRCRSLDLDPAHLKEVLEEAKKIKAKEDRIEDLVRVGMSLNEARQQK